MVDAAAIIEDVSFRISENGEFFGIDFVGRDGRMRSAAFSSTVLLKILAGCLWASAEAGLHGVEAPLSDAVRAALQEGAPVITGLALQSDGAGGVLELGVGAGAVFLRAPPEALRRLLYLLAEHFEVDGGSPQ